MNHIDTLARTGDSPWLLIVGGIILLALVVLLIAFLVLKRKR